MRRTSPFKLGAVPNVRVMATPTGLASIRPAAQDGLIYSLPVHLLEQINRYAPDFLSAEELGQEFELAEFCCRFYSIAMYKPTTEHPFPRLVPFQFLYPPQPLRTSCNAVPNSPSIICDDIIRQSQCVLDDLREKQIAFLGWLLHNQEFLRDKAVLQEKYYELLQFTKSYPKYPAHHFVHCLESVHGLRANKNLLKSFADDFDAFFQKWQIAGLATRDIPIPSGAVLGGPASIVKFIPDQDGPTVKLPGTLRLQARARPENLLRSPAQEHLQDWALVQDQKHPSKISYSRWVRLFQLALYREIVLVRNYPNKVILHSGKLDEAFSEFFGDKDVQAVKRIRTKQRMLLGQSESE